jgi:hypothetical protein
MPQHTLIVTGAGVDKTPGIDFPLAADLLPAINGYLTRTDDGRALDALIRSKIPGLRFKFDRFINNAITDIAQREPEQLRQTIESVQRVIDLLPDDDANRKARKQGELIVRLFNQLQQIATANLIDEETRDLIEEVFGENSSQFDLDDHVVDIRTLNVIHFHGGLNKYVRMDNRQLLSFDHFSDQTASELLASHICDNWYFNEDDPAKSRCLSIL